MVEKTQRNKKKSAPKKPQRLTVQWAYEKGLVDTGNLKYKGVIVSSIEQNTYAGFDIVAGLTFRRVDGGDLIHLEPGGGAGKPSKYKNKMVYAYEGSPDVMHRNKVSAGRWADSGELRLNLGKLLKFDSMAEYRYWVHLKSLEAAGEIRNVKTQVSYELYARFEWQGKTYKRTYRVDFTYQRELKDGLTQLVLVDVKGFETELFKLKWELFISYHYDLFASRQWYFDLVQAKEWS